ncbi:MAG: tetratricopeptide repeat protein, partial [Cyanobacteria bacterium J06588_4]
MQTLQTSVAKLDQLAQKLEQEQNETRKLAKELKAIEKFTQMIDKNGEAAQPYYLRGSAYQRSGNIERAIEDLTKAI